MRIIPRFAALFQGIGRVLALLVCLDPAVRQIRRQQAGACYERLVSGRTESETFAASWDGRC